MSETHALARDAAPAGGGLSEGLDARRALLASPSWQETPGAGLHDA